MTLCHLLVSLPLLATGDEHAALHPHDANFYVELPDLPGILRAYGDAPLVQLLNDPQLGAFAAKVMGGDPETFQLTDEIDRQLERRISRHSDQLAHAWELLQETRSFSASLSTDALNELLATLTEGQTSDWSALVDRHFGSQLVIEFESTESARQFGELVAELTGAAYVEDPEHPTLSLMGIEADLQRWRAGGPEQGVEFWTTAVDRRLVLGMGRSTPGALQHRLQDPTRALDRQPGFNRGRAAFQVAEGTTAYEIYFRMEEFGDLLQLALADLSGKERHIAATLLDKLIPGGTLESHARTRLVGSRFLTEEFQSGPPTEGGLFACLGGEPVDPGTFALLPADAVGVWVTTIDPDVLLEQLMTLAQELTGEDPVSSLVELEEQYGFRPIEDLFQAVGTKYALYVKPITGLTLPRVHLAVELRDPVAFQRGMEGLGRFAHALSEGEIEVESRPYRKVPVLTFAPRKDIGELAGDLGAPTGLVSLAPGVLDPVLSVAILEDRAVFGLSAMNVKKEVKRLLRGEGAGEHPLVRESNLFPADATSVAYLDWGSILGGFYTTFRTFVPLIAQASPDLPFDPADLPEPDLFPHYFKPTVSYSTQVDGGAYHFARSSFGPEVPAALVATGLLGTVVASSTPARELEPDIVIETVPANPQRDEGKEQPREDDPARDGTKQRLQELRVALVLYRTEAERYPTELDALAQPSQSFPKGFLNGEPVPTDAWGNAFRYTVEPDGGGYRLWSTGADGVDQSGAGDDVTLP